MAGGLFLVVPKLETAREQYGISMEAFVWSREAALGPADTAIWTAAAIGRAAALTFGMAVFEHPILTILFGLGLFLAGIALLVEYGFRPTDAEPWRDEFDM